jgi:malate dehydrogenase (oxaloacetate-decarboxylating)
MARVCSPSYSITIRLEFENRIGMFAQITNAISKAGGDLGSVDIVRVKKWKIVRDVTVNACDEAHEKEIVKSIQNISGIKVRRVMDRTFTAHLGGKIEVRSRMPIRDQNELSKVYTPGVARICRDITKRTDHVYRGPEAAMPVMEGKAMIFKEFAGINAFPIALGTKKTEDIIHIVKNIATPFGGINLEDIAAPRCFDIEQELHKSLSIPVIHDDQHGTAVVILAALMNVARLMKRNIKKLKIVLTGAGAAGLATASLLSTYGIKDIIVCDRTGTIYEKRRMNMNKYKKAIARKTNPRRVKGRISDAMEGADVFIGVSAPNIITSDDIKRMSKNPVVFALANPEPEIAPEEALPLVRVLATGRSDYPNQINNMLSFPGLFRGLLDVRANSVNEQVKFAAARAIATTIAEDELHDDYIIPSIFDKKVVSAVAYAVAEAARKTGVALQGG